MLRLHSLHLLSLVLIDQSLELGFVVLMILPEEIGLR